MERIGQQSEGDWLSRFAELTPQTDIQNHFSSRKKYPHKNRIKGPSKVRFLFLPVFYFFHSTLLYPSIPSFLSLYSLPFLRFFLSFFLVFLAFFLYNAAFPAGRSKMIQEQISSVARCKADSPNPKPKTFAKDKTSPS